jgi:hypothetical protein
MEIIEIRIRSGQFEAQTGNTSGAKPLGVVISGRFRSAFLVFFVIFWRFEKVLQVMNDIDLDQDRRVNETRCPEIAWK